MFSLQNIELFSGKQVDFFVIKLENYKGFFLKIKTKYIHCEVLSIYQFNIVIKK